MRKLVQVLIVATLLIPMMRATVSERPVAAATGELSPDNRYIVVMRDSARATGLSTAAVARTFSSARSLKVKRVFSRGVNGFSATISDSDVSKLRNDARVQGVYVDRKHQLPSYTVSGSDPLTPQVFPTGIQRIGVLENSVAKVDGIEDPMPVTVAVIDTGVDTEHPDLNVVGGLDCSFSGTYDDNAGHGTHVAGTIGAKDNDIGVVGVAPGAGILAIRVEDPNGSIYDSYLICAFNFVAANSKTIGVANMSIGGPLWDISDCRNSPWAMALCDLYKSGVPLAVSAGNDNLDAAVTTSAYPGPTIVSAMADSDGLPGATGSATTWGSDDTLAGFSNFGQRIDIAAPGVDILSTVPIEYGSYDYYSGTSMASPHVAGAIALAVAQFGQLSPESAESLLRSSREAVHLPNDLDGIDEGILSVRWNNGTSLFSASFSSGVGSWSSSAGAVTQSVNGSLAAVLTASASPAFLLKTFTPATQVYAQTKFMVSSGSSFEVLSLQSATGGSPVRVRVSSGKSLQLTASGGISLTSLVAVVPGKWYDLTLFVDASSGAIDVYLNGALVSALHVTAGTPRSLPGKILIGSTSSKTFKLTVDNVAIGDRPSRDLVSTDNTKPSVPGAVTTSLGSNSRVTLNWGAATDNVGIGQYVIFRNGWQLASVNNTRTFVDTRTLPGMTYDYQVFARDITGNRSLTAASAMRTVPGIFGDDFASNNLSKWTAIFGSPAPIVGESGPMPPDSRTLWLEDYGGTKAVRKEIAGSYSDMTFALRFYTAADTPSLELMSLRNSTGSNLVRIWTTSDKKIWARVTGQASSILLADGFTDLWHELRISTSGSGMSSRTVTIALDGVVIGSAALGSGSRIAQLVVGSLSASQGGFTVVDDVSVVAGAADNVSRTDVTPPTAPTNITVENNANNGALVSWTAPTDNKGVAAIWIKRDEAHAWILGAGVTSYFDPTALPGETYTYTLRSVDTSRNMSPEVSSAPLDIPAVFADTFDDFDSDGWTVTQSAPGFAQVDGGNFGEEGAFALSTESGGWVRADTMFSSPQTEAFVGARIRSWVALGQEEGTNLLTLLDATGNPVLGLSLSATRTVSLVNYTNDTIAGSTVEYWKDNATNDVQMHVSVSGGTATVHTWIGGNYIPALSGTTAVGAVTMGGIRLGVDQDGTGFYLQYQFILALDACWTICPVGTPGASFSPLSVAEANSTAYPVMALSRSGTEAEAGVLLDNRLDTVWQDVAVRREIEVTADLGAVLPVGNVEWRTGPDGLVGQLDISVSADGEAWRRIDLAGAAPVGDTTKVPINDVIRYVRWTVTPETRGGEAGGLAEIAVFPPEEGVEVGQVAPDLPTPTAALDTPEAGTPTVEEATAVPTDEPSPVETAAPDAMATEPVTDAVVEVPGAPETTPTAEAA